MTRVEHHPTDFHLLYAGWALPGTSESAAGWRIVKFVWAGNVLDHYEWADGDDLLNNVWTNRATLTYVVNDALSLEAAGWVDLDPSGTRPGTNFSVPCVLSSRDEVWRNGGPMMPVGGAPLPGQVQVSSTGDFVTGSDVGTGEWLFLRKYL